MAVTLTGTSPGDQGLFNRLGALGNVLNIVNSFVGELSSGKLRQEALDAIALYDGDDDVQRLPIDGFGEELDAAQRAFAGYARQIKARAQGTLVTMFDVDAKLTRRTVNAALAVLRTQMLTATTRYVDANAVSAAVTKTSLTGNGAIVVICKDGQGRNLENLLAETINITVSSSTPDFETLVFRGQNGPNNKLDAEWPAGSNAVLSLTSIAASGGSNKILGGDFETFTIANTPDNWSIVTGSAGTEVLSEASIVYKGAKALKIVGAATLTKLSQTLTGLTAQRNYAGVLWVKTSGTPAAGVLKVDLYDGSAVINDQAGTANSITIDLTTIGTSYVAVPFDFRLPDPIPTSVSIRVRLTTALSVGTSLYIDEIIMREATQLDSGNPGGTPFVAAFSGSAGWALGDGAEATVFKIVTANDRASLWQQLFDKFFDTSDVGYILPIAGTTLVNDSLIG